MNPPSCQYVTYPSVFQIVSIPCGSLLIITLRQSISEHRISVKILFLLKVENILSLSCPSRLISVLPPGIISPYTHHRIFPLLNSPLS